VVLRVEDVGQAEHVHLGIEGAQGPCGDAADGHGADLDLLDGHLLIAGDLPAGKDIDLEGAAGVLVDQASELLVGQLGGIALGVDLGQLEYHLGLCLHGRCGDDAKPDQQAEYDSVQLHDFLLLG
jgi:hypothetical protein